MAKTRLTFTPYPGFEVLETIARFIAVPAALGLIISTIELGRYVFDLTGSGSAVAIAIAAMYAFIVLLGVVGWISATLSGWTYDSLWDDIIRPYLEPYLGRFLPRR